MNATVVETRFDSLIQRVSMLEAVVPFSARPAVREIRDELVHIRRDLSGLGDVELAPPPEPAPRQFKQSNASRHAVKQRDGKRHCPRHDDAHGAWLPVEAFDVKNKATGARRSWCRECTRAYQRERYVAVTAKTMTVELIEGDRCIGHDCPDCGLPFEVGDRIRGENLHHDKCAP